MQQEYNNNNNNNANNNQQQELQDINNGNGETDDYIQVRKLDDGSQIRVPKLMIQSILKQREEDFKLEADAKIIHVPDQQQADALAADIGEQAARAAINGGNYDDDDLIMLEDMAIPTSERIRRGKAAYMKKQLNKTNNPLKDLLNNDEDSANNINWKLKLQSTVLSWVGLGDSKKGGDSLLKFLYHLFHQAAHETRFLNRWWFIELFAKLVFLLQILGLVLENRLPETWGTVSTAILYWYNVVVRSFGFELIASDFDRYGTSTVVMRLLPTPLFFLASSVTFTMVLLSYVMWRNQSHRSTYRTLHHSNQSIKTLRESAYQYYADGMLTKATILVVFFDCVFL